MLTGYSLLTHNYELSYVQTMCKEKIESPIVDTIEDANQKTRRINEEETMLERVQIYT